MKIRLRSLFSNRASPALCAALLTLAVTPAVRADDCSNLENVVYVAGSSAAKPFIAAVATELAGLATPITVVYQGAGSCVGVNYFTTATVGTITGTASIWDAAGTVEAPVEGTCTIPTTATVDVGVSDVFADSCPGVTTLPAGIKDFHGPTQAMTFVVPEDSTHDVISAEAAYLVFGFGNDGEVSPWNDVSYIEQRSDTSGTQQMIAAFIKVPASKFKGHANAKSGDLITSLAASATGGNADKAIGILATDATDKNPATLNVLGYQHFDQSCAYWPGSTKDSFDKANVRDGHYPISGPLHMLAKTSGGTIQNTSVKKFVDYLSGEATPNFDLIKIEAKGGVVPECAMSVTRTKDGGSAKAFTPEKSCACKFVKEATGDAPAECKVCTVKTDCKDKKRPNCNYGFCEVK